MLDYAVAVKFEQAGDVRRTLEYVGKKPTTEDDRYIHELQEQLCKSEKAVCVVCGKSDQCGDVCTLLQS